VFTTNRAQAAPVSCRRRASPRPAGRSRVVVINSGCANACTGPDGLATAEAMPTPPRAARRCAAQALVASTGVIGVSLDRARVTRGIAAAVRRCRRDGGPRPRARS
jgi:glutamate N-acetyltransferase/amino-acid N-acetyltransferase